LIFLTFIWHKYILVFLGSKINSFRPAVHAWKQTAIRPGRPKAFMERVKNLLAYAACTAKKKKDH